MLGYDEERAWLLLADAGRPVGDLGNPPEAWLAALPRYAELQHGEAAHAHEHLAHGVPDLRLETLPARYQELLGLELPLERDGIGRLRDLAPRLGELWRSSPPTACRRRSSTTTSTTPASTWEATACGRWTGATRRSPIRRAIAYIRQRAALRPEQRPLFDADFSTVLRRALAQTLGDASS